MVRVLPQCRGRGHASRLLREALGWLSARGLLPVLDATPAGHPVYRREGFVDAWRLARHARAGSRCSGRSRECCTLATPRLRPAAPRAIRRRCG
ncbi:MAG: GNAT family N-acetyltransferase [Burkholderiales bacterium]